MPDRLGWGRIAAMLICGFRRKHLPAKTKEKRGRRGLGPRPLRCLNQTLSEGEERECLDCLILAFRFAYLSPLGWLCIYNVYCSQFEGCKDSLPLDEIFLALYRMRY